jgi:hypothetical protein
MSQRTRARHSRAEDPVRRIGPLLPVGPMSIGVLRFIEQPDAVSILYNSPRQVFAEIQPYDVVSDDSGAEDRDSSDESDETHSDDDDIMHDGGCQGRLFNLTSHISHQPP